MKQPTTKQRFKEILNAADLLTPGFDPSSKKIAETSTVSGVLECIKNLKEVHLSGGNAGQFLNEMEKLCLEHITKNAIEAVNKLKAAADEVTDKITDPKKN